MADKHGLTVKELAFVSDRIIDGRDLSECYKRYNPGSKQGKDNRRRSGWRTMEEIKNKVGGWKEIYALAGLGPDRIAKVYEDALTADNEEGRADHNIRLKAAKNLQDIHGLSEETLNVKLPDPLPLVVVMEKEKDKGDE